MSVDLKAAKLLQMAIKDVPANVCQTANENMQEGRNFLETRIPFEKIAVLGVEEVLPYIKEFELDKPENLVRFLIELHFACFDSVNQGMEEVRDDLLQSVVSRIDSVKDSMKYAEKNPADCEGQVQDCILKLSDVTNDLIGKLNSYIKMIREIDERPAFVFFLKSKVDLKKVDSCMDRASMALKGYLEAVNLLAIIGTNYKKNVENYIDKAEKYIEDLSRNGNISLMLAYEKDQKGSVWNSEELHSKIQQIRTLSDGLQELYESEIDFENNVIF
ncbi:MAG: hypothetical protein E7294_14195 [Lachnospiraceae bacterium]|nr:hypothetical protein [Lachnospiraceae bacterium]